VGNYWCEVSRCDTAFRECTTDADCMAGETCNPPVGGECVEWNNADFATMSALLWDPSTDRWSELASQTRPRMYHSTALLLPDGRVISMGGGKRQGLENQRNAEVFSPPYLFQGPRPVISSSVDAIGYGLPFGVSVMSPDATQIDRVTLIRLGSVTHQFDMGQRFVELQFSATSGGDEGGLITAVSPSGPEVAPPGWYMLFLLDDGVPSEAWYLRIE
jgi:hypothetical protein